MNYEKTGRLIKRKRNAKGMTQLQLSEAIGVTPQAVSLWENGNRFPDPSAQVMLFKALDLNPVELLTGLEMYDEDLKKRIAGHMDRIDENVFVAGMVTDEDGIEQYLDLSKYEIVSKDEEGERIPYAEYYNAEPPKNHENTDALPTSEYDPGNVYINHGHCILVIPVEILEKMGKPLFFNIIRNTEAGWMGFHFTDDMGQNTFDIPEKVYNGEWKGIHVLDGDFGRSLCKEMGIRRTVDLIAVEPEYHTEFRTVILPLDRAKRVNTELEYSAYLLPQWQYDEMAREDEEDYYESFNEDE